MNIVSLSEKLKEGVDPTSPPSAGTLLDPRVINSIANPSTSLSSDALSSLDQTLKTVTGGKGLQISAITSLADCAKSLEDRVQGALQNAITSLILKSENGKAAVEILQTAKQYQSAIQDLITFVKNANPKDLASSLLQAQAATGINKIAAVAKIREEFGDKVLDINSLLDKINDLNICTIPNVNIAGQNIPNPLLMPNRPPVPSAFPAPTAVNETVQAARGDYESLMISLRSYIGADVNTAAPQTLTSSLNTLAFAYHNKIYSSTSDVDDARYHEEYLRGIQTEIAKRSNDWTADNIREFEDRANGAGLVLKNRSNVIREYVTMKNPTITEGSFLSTGVTYYSGVFGDLTTFLEVFREQRPPAAVKHWESRGVNIAEQERRMVARGLRVSYIPLSWSTSAAYGELKSDFTCASTRVPGGSVLALKNTDGTPYDPTSRNPAGIYTVTDTGNATLTYNKVDIYTDTPRAYTSFRKTPMDAVKVFLVSAGTKTNKQYEIAQRRAAGRATVS